MRLLLACLFLICLILAFPSPGFLQAQGLGVRVSVKRVLDASDTLPTDGFFYQDAQVERAIDAANDILVASGADWRLELVEILNITGISQWYDIRGTSLRGLELQAMANPALYGWRSDAINIYVTRLVDWRGFCSIPDAGGSTDVIVINNDAWFISPAPMPLSTLPEEEDFDLAAGYLWLHEIGHYFNLCHTQGCCCGFACGTDQDPSRPPVGDDGLLDTLRDLECWSANDMANWSFSNDYLDLLLEQRQQVDDTILNVMSYHRKEIFAADQAVLTEGQLARMDVEMTQDSGRRSSVVTGQLFDGAFRRGDVDGSGDLELSDPIQFLLFLILGQGSVSCRDAADASDDGRMGITDAIVMLTVMFLTGDMPAPGLESCGLDPTTDALDCESYVGDCS